MLLSSPHSCPCYDTTHRNQRSAAFKSAAHTDHNSYVTKGTSARQTGDVDRKRALWPRKTKPHHIWYYRHEHCSCLSLRREESERISYAVSLQTHCPAGRACATVQRVITIHADAIT